MVASGYHSEQYKELQSASVASAYTCYVVLVCASTVFYNSTNKGGRVGYLSLRQSGFWWKNDCIFSILKPYYILLKLRHAMFSAMK